MTKKLPISPVVKADWHLAIAAGRAGVLKSPSLHWCPSKVLNGVTHEAYLLGSF
jgi:hypothetical protein